VPQKTGRNNPVRPDSYQITFLGQASRALRAEFDGYQVTIGPGTTTLHAELPDQGALTGLMQRLSGLGLDVIDISLAAPPPRQ
jgi:hypothetical protein